MILIACSNKDLASLNIRKIILEQHTFDKANGDFQGSPILTATIESKQIGLVTLNQESTHAQDLESAFGNLELVVFISRHSSETGTPTLSVHTPGNLCRAELGGLPRKVSISPANAMRNALLTMARLRKEAGLDYAVSYEATHHGPSLDVPAMFVELGSSVAQWNDMKAAEIVAHAAMKAISSLTASPVKTVVGVGGPHYNAKFTRIALEDELAFGHMIPKYAIPDIDKSVFEQCIRRTLEKVDRAVLDWKGIKGENKRRLVSILEDIGIAFEKA